MTMPFQIAWRYLWGHKSHNAINIVSGVSAAAVAVVTAAMICVMSVMNGFGTVIESMFSQLDPDLRITAVQGNRFSTDNDTFVSLRALPCVQVMAETIEETALIEYNDQQLPATIKGVDTNYQQLTNIDSILIEGRFLLQRPSSFYAVMGVGLSNRLNISAQQTPCLQLYAPKRNARVNLMHPEDSFNSNGCFVAGVFAVDQVQYDDHIILVPLPLAQRLFDFAEHEVTSVELKINGSVRTAQKQIKKLLGDDYNVLNQYEQQEDFFHILRIEKWLTWLLLVFILLIASFNIIGSLTMLILDKQKDIQILHHLGADEPLIRRIFLLEGWLISSVGAVSGLMLGVIACLLQEHLGLIKLGDGAQYVLSAYPVHVEITDLIVVIIIVLGLGFAAAWYPARHISVNTPTE